MSEWIPFKELDFKDESIKQYHIDTRDFHCSINLSEETEIDGDKLPITKGFALLNKYPDKFFHTPEEVLATITRLYEESHGENSWRVLTLEGEGEKYTSGWQIKYLRIYRLNGGLIICNSKNYALRKSILACPVNQEYLHAHTLKKSDNNSNESETIKI